MEARDELQNDFLQIALTACWNKLEKHYVLTDETPLYYAAVVLNPTLKMQYSKQIWSHKSSQEQAWIIQVENQVRAIYEGEYKVPTRNAPRVSCPSDETPRGRLWQAKRLKLNHSDVEAAPDELTDYLSSDPLPYDKEAPFDCVACWYGRQTTSPQLARFAPDVFRIPLMSDNNERQFSAGRDMITYRRTCLQPDVIEACQCLKTWIGEPHTAENVEGDDVEAFDDEEAVSQQYETEINSDPHPLS